jgi:hypothetical protein
LLATRKRRAGARERERISIIAGGEKSRTATLMKRYDAPQIAASRLIRNQYERSRVLTVPSEARDTLAV